MAPTASDPIERRLKKLQRKAERVKADVELRKLDAEIPLSPLPRLAVPNRPRRSWSKSASHGAAEAAAAAAARRAGAAETKSKQRAAAAERAAADAVRERA